jgi:hypothetical protein
MPVLAAIWMSQAARLLRVRKPTGYFDMKVSASEDHWSMPQADRRSMAWRARYFLIGGVALITAVGLIGWQSLGGRGEVLTPDGGPVVTVMDFGQSFPLDPLPSGWRHRKFWTRSPMTIASAVKDGVPSLRFETHDSASKLFRAVDIDPAAYPMLAWRWLIELPIKSPLDERTREGRRSPGAALSSVHERSRREACDGGDLGQSAETGDYKYIGGFPHFVADAGDDRVGRWLDERIDLVRVYAGIWKDAAPTHLVDVAVFCDSDDTHTASISYFAYVRLEQR